VLGIDRFNNSNIVGIMSMYLETVLLLNPTPKLEIYINRIGASWLGKA